MVFSRSVHGVLSQSRILFWGGIGVIVASMLLQVVLTRSSLAFFRSDDRDPRWYQVQDFTYHLTLSDALWRKVIDDPYQDSMQRKAISERYGIEAPAAMPVGISPGTFYVLYPFVILEAAMPGGGYFAWSLVVCLLLVGAAASCRRTAVAGGVVLFLALAVTTESRIIELGQTSLAVFASLIILSQLPRDSSRGKALGILARGATLALAVAVVSCKLPIWIASVVYFGVKAQRATVSLLVGGFALLQGAAALMWGHSMLGSYLIALLNYQRLAPGSLSRMSVHTMTPYLLENVSAAWGLPLITGAFLVWVLTVGFALVAPAKFWGSSSGWLAFWAYALLGAYVPWHDRLLFMIPWMLLLIEDSTPASNTPILFLALAWLVSTTIGLTVHQYMLLGLFGWLAIVLARHPSQSVQRIGS